MPPEVILQVLQQRAEIFVYFLHNYGLWGRVGPGLQGRGGQPAQLFDPSVPVWKDNRKLRRLAVECQIVIAAAFATQLT
jgi:hypothetical protein